MATLVLTAAGSVFGPIGAAIGAVAGRSIDAQIFSSGTRQGPRLKELSVSTSSYGTPMAGHYGTVRTPGTIFWATDLEENSSSEGGGKGKPETTSYSYSVSFAVALSSLPIDGIGRIWADGNLLRGSAGDLKAGGSLRIHRGARDQDRDPLLEAELGSECPAHRGLAYAVFEDLDLTDFGNRIPALSFEVFAGHGNRFLDRLLETTAASVGGQTNFPELMGFSHEGGSIREIISLIDRLKPVRPVIGDGVFEIHGAEEPVAPVLRLPPASAWDDGDFAPRSGHSSSRNDRTPRFFSALRYYDADRDFQPGLQQVATTESDWDVFEFPGVMAAADARHVADGANRRKGFMTETLAYRTAELDPRLTPGKVVSVPGRSGLWLILSWEWREAGFEFHLARHRSDLAEPRPTDPGNAWKPLDRLGADTSLRVFELPWDGSGSSQERVAFAAIGAGTGRWAGARLYAETGSGLVDTGLATSRRAGNGKLKSALSPSSGLRFEPISYCEVTFEDIGQRLSNTDIDGIASGANRVLVGEEIIQFLSAVPLGDRSWRLSGLLRGRGGTELEAAQGHAADEAVTLLDDKLVKIGSDVLTQAGSEFVALGLTDDEPAAATLENPAASLRPPCPVHGTCETDASGVIALSWTRRARGGWNWLDEVDQPLVEEVEAYEIGLGPLQTPAAIWNCTQPNFAIPAIEAAELRQQFPDQPLWVRQCGSHAKSHALKLSDNL